MKPRVSLKYVLPLALLFAVAAGWWWWPRSQDFYHQPASYQYHMLGGNDEALLAQWRARGPEGIQELVRRIPVRNRYFGEKYQSFVWWLQRKNWPALANWLPAPRIYERISHSRTCVLLLTDLGLDACTPQSVSALAQAVGDPNSEMASDAVDCLSKWGPAASNAIPALIKGQRDAIKQGRPMWSAGLEACPQYARALAAIGINSKEILIELLRVRRVIPLINYAVTWCRNSSQAPDMLLEIVTNQSVELDIRVGAIGAANTCQIENLLPYVARTLAEPKLGPSWQFYLRRMNDKAGPYLGEILNQLGMLADVGCSTNAGRREWEDILFDLGHAGRTRAEELCPIVLRYALDETWPFALGYAWAKKPRNLHEVFAEILKTLVRNQELHPDLILSGLEHSDWRVRAGAAEQLLFDKLGPRETAALLKCLRDENATVRAIAAQLLFRVEAHRPEALKETWSVITNRTLPFRRRICAISSLYRDRLSAGEKLEAVKILDTLAEEPEAELRYQVMMKRKELVL